LIGEVKFMDMLYRAYSNPMDLMRMYINQGRFGTFVRGFLEEEHKRREEEAKKDNDWKLWVAYVHSYSDKSFEDWKNNIIKSAKSESRRGRDDELTTEGGLAIVDKVLPRK
jgi:hypothetical protein